MLNQLGIETAAVVGWSDGACTGLALAKAHPERVRGVFFLRAMWMRVASGRSK